MTGKTKEAIRKRIAETEQRICRRQESIEPDRQRLQFSGQTLNPLATCQSIDWYHTGQSRTVQVDGVQVTVRLVGRKGRRARIAVTSTTAMVISSIERPG